MSGADLVPGRRRGRAGHRRRTRHRPRHRGGARRRRMGSRLHLGLGRSVGTRGGGADGGRAFRLDLRDRARPATLVAEVEKELGPVSGLVNNAAVRREGILAMTSDADWDEVLDVNLGGRLPLLPRRAAGHGLPAPRRDREHLVAQRGGGPARPDRLRGVESGPHRPHALAGPRGRAQGSARERGRARLRGHGADGGAPSGRGREAARHGVPARGHGPARRGPDGRASSSPTAPPPSRARPSPWTPELRRDDGGRPPAHRRGAGRRGASCRPTPRSRAAFAGCWDASTSRASSGIAFPTTRSATTSCPGTPSRPGSRSAARSSLSSSGTSATRSRPTWRRSSALADSGSGSAGSTGRSQPSPGVMARATSRWSIRGASTSRWRAPSTSPPTPRAASSSSPRTSANGSSPRTSPRTA